MSRLLTVLRVRTVSAEALSLCTRIAASGRSDVCIAINDPSAEPGRSGAFAVVPVTETTIRAAGLLYTDEVPWRCGDYPLVLAYIACPDYDFYYQIESDVFVNAADIGAFFDGLQADATTDFLAAELGAAHPAWFWYDTIAPFAQTVRRCLFPFVRFSRAALDYVLAERRHFTNLFHARLDFDGNVRGFHDWPNDESFCATMIVQRGLSAADLNETERAVWSRRTFSFATPISRRRLEAGPRDGLLYHPVLAGAKFLAKSRAILAAIASQSDPAFHGREAFGGNGFLDDLALECGADVAATFAAELDRLGAAPGPG